eukprot:403341364
MLIFEQILLSQKFIFSNNQKQVCAYLDESQQQSPNYFNVFSDLIKVLLCIPIYQDLRSKQVNAIPCNSQNDSLSIIIQNKGQQQPIIPNQQFLAIQQPQNQLGGKNSQVRFSVSSLLQNNQRQQPNDDQVTSFCNLDQTNTSAANHQSISPVHIRLNSNANLHQNQISSIYEGDGSRENSQNTQHPHTARLMSEENNQDFRDSVQIKMNFPELNHSNIEYHQNMSTNNLNQYSRHSNSNLNQQDMHQHLSLENFQSFYQSHKRSNDFSQPRMNSGNMNSSFGQSHPFPSHGQDHPRTSLNQLDLMKSESKCEIQKQSSLQIYNVKNKIKIQDISRTLGPNAINMNMSPDRTPIKQSFTAEHTNIITSDRFKSFSSGNITRQNLRNKIQNLEKQLTNTKIFLSMVIHDMKNPTNSIDFALKEVLTLLNINSKDVRQRFRNPFNSQQNSGAIIRKTGTLRSSQKQSQGQHSGCFNPFVGIQSYSGLRNSLMDQRQSTQNFQSSVHQSMTINNQNQFPGQLNVIEEEEIKGEDSNSRRNHNTLQNQRHNELELFIEDTEQCDILTDRSQHEERNNVKSFVAQESHSKFGLSHEKKRFIQLSDLQPLDFSSLSQEPRIKFQEVLEGDQHFIPSNRYSSRQRHPERQIMSFGVFNISENSMNDNPLLQLNPSNDLSLIERQNNIIKEFQDNGILMNDQKRQYAEQLLKNSMFGSTMLLNLINDLLDLAKIENSSFNLNTSYFNLFETIQKAIDTIEFQAQQKNIFIQNEFSEDKTEYFVQILGDQNRYLQILLNFLSNSIKFTPTSGKIIIQTNLLDKQRIQKAKEFAALENLKNLKSGEIEVKTKRNRSLSMGTVDVHKLEGISSDNNQYYIDFEIKIIDSGMGISKENMQKIFLNFGKLDEHSKVNHGGTGLGLSICKSLIELMGGSVRVESEKDKGTTFIMSLKTKCNIVSKERAKKIMQKIYGFESVPDLVIEEADDINQSRQQYDFSHGQTQTIQEGFQQNNKKPKKSKKNDQKIKQFKSFNPYIEEESKGNGLKIGLRGLLQMPSAIDCEDNFSPLNYSQQHQDYQPLTPIAKSNKRVISPNSRAKKFKALIANDEVFQLMIIMRVFQQSNFIVDDAENGLVAVNKSKIKHYDVIILDLNMPIMGGIEACKKIRSESGSGIQDIIKVKSQSELFDESIPHKPLIIALSAFADENIIKQCLEDGFDDFIMEILELTNRSIIINSNNSTNNNSQFHHHLVMCNLNSSNSIITK